MTDRHAPDRHAFDHHDDRELDALLNEALTTYVDQEPDPSLRARVFARMDEAAQPLRRMWHIGSLAAAACAAALLLAFLLHPAKHTLEHRAVQDRAVNAPAATAAPPPVVSANLDDTLTHSARPHIVAATGHSYNSRKPAPSRRSISLTSAPLTEEEATLLRFAEQHPEQAREVLSPPPSRPLQTDPLIIAPIQIADLSDSRPDSH